MRDRLRWGLIGGGEGSQIGDAHRIAARIDGMIDLTAAALDADPERGKAYARSLGVVPDRAYGTWQAMLAGEKDRPDRLDFVTVATPNATHFDISKAFIENGFHVLCEKPLTMKHEEAAELLELADRHKGLLSVNFGYSGYPMVREARTMVEQGDLGKVRLVVAEFAHGFHADAADADNPRIRWRYDPEQAGESSVLADAGIHALHMIGYVLSQPIEAISADFISHVDGRELEDDAALNVRYSGGTVGRLWTSAIAVGQFHGLNIRIFGEKGGLRWHQEAPSQLFWTPVGQPTVVIERGHPNTGQASRDSSRIAIGHAEGMLVAFANIYRDLASVIRTEDEAARADYLARLPTGAAGAEMVAAVAAAARSARANGAWQDLT